MEVYNFILTFLPSDIITCKHVIVFNYIYIFLAVVLISVSFKDFNFICPPSDISEVIESEFWLVACKVSHLSGDVLVML